jgi:uncharacterized protein involved in type VI secretion and phage assembly
VGPSGEEIFTDEHGRIKVQFHWDRAGQRDERSSCFLRVAQQSMTVHGKRTEEVTGQEKLTLHGGRDTTVNTLEKLTVTGKRDETIGGNDDLTVEGDKTAQSELKLVCGSSSITLASDGTITLSGSTEVKMSSGPSFVKATPSAVQSSAPAVSSSATGGNNEISGTLVKINS